MPHEHILDRAGTRDFLLKILIAVGVVAFVLFLWQISNALLMVLASVVIAVILVMASAPFERHLSLSRRWALTAAVALIIVVIGLLALLIGSQVQSQVSELFSRLPQALRSVEQQLGISSAAVGQPGEGAQAGNTLSRLVQDFGSWLASFGTTLLNALAGFVLVVIAGVFLAANPDLYRRGLIKLFPPRFHDRVAAALDDSGRALRLWVRAELIAMAIVGVLVGLGTWLIGLPAPLALGLIAGLTEFIPILGPIIGAVPALVLALTQGGGSFLWTALLFLAIQQLESNVITPLLEKRMVELPPALVLFAVVAFGLVFGILGVIVAAPLLVVAFVLVKKLYVRDTLGEPTEVPGER